VKLKPIVESEFIQLLPSQTCFALESHSEQPEKKAANCICQHAYVILKLLVLQKPDPRL
jgi:hypothetical protein